MRRRKLLAVLAGLAVLVAVGTFVLRPQPTPLTRQTFHRIGRGMSGGEIESILGAPQVELPVKFTWDPRVSSAALWCSPTGQIEVAYDASGKVCDTQLNGLGYVPTWSERLQWKWRKWFP